MQALRQFGLAIAIAVISLGLIVGGLSLALSESFTPPPVPTQVLVLPTQPALLTPTNTPQVLPSATLPPTATNTVAPPAGCTPPAGWIGVVVGAADTLPSMAARYHTTSQALAQGNCLLTESLVPGSILFVPPLPTSVYVPPTATRAIPCGAPYGWIRYAVQQGDTLYHIATSYGITTTQLQRANCMGASTTIYVGQLLWVPNVPTVTPGPTYIPPFDTVTPYPTLPLTLTALPDTATPVPSNTPIPSPTLTAFPTP